MNNSITVNSGENVTIHCQRFSNITYTWTKDEEVVSDNSDLHLPSVSAASAGLYMLTVNTGNSNLQKAFYITVSTQTTIYWEDASTLPPHHNSSSESETTGYTQNTPLTTENTQKLTNAIPILYNQTDSTMNFTSYTSYNQTSEGFSHTEADTTTSSYNQSEASESFNQSESHNTTIRYNESESFATVSGVTQHFNHSETFNTNASYNHSVPVHTPRPFVIDTRTENLSVTYDSTLNQTERPSKAFKSSTSAPSTEYSIPRKTTNSFDFTVRQDPEENESKGHLVGTLIIIIGLLLLIVALFLYRRRVIKKRMDLPPPFKPPPPPTKYAAVKTTSPFPTDRCNSLTVQSSMEMRHSLV
ncbi:hypothetical protein WMY93_008494 [Mugilogobius chulae]|uniref:Immunoglobulin domain-containing protein n=1 Tax=Mugilogobius chulae TaxID=88201 RepID=A0AAW0PMH9_9GOBI